MDKMPVYRNRDAFRLANHLKKNGPRIARELEARMAAVLEDGEELPDLAHLLDVLGRMVLAEEKNLDARDYEKENRDIEVTSARMDLRRKAMPRLRSRVQEVRKMMRSYLEPEEIKKILSFEGRTPRDDGGLEKLAITMVRQLPTLEPIPAPGGSVDPAGWAEYLRQPLAEARYLLGAIDDHTDNRIVSVQQKSQAMKTFDKLFRRVARVGRIFHLMAGMEARSMVYSGGRPGIKTGKPRRPRGVA